MSPKKPESNKQAEALKKQLEAAQANLEKKAQELEQACDRALLLQADFENAKKRWLKSEAEFQERANADLLGQLLEIFDDFTRAVQAADTDPKTFREGVGMIASRFEQFLTDYGVKPLNAAGQPFDPTRHEAVAHEATDQAPESTVLEELRKGYIMNNRVLRPSVVKVAVKPADGKAEKPDEKSSDRS